ncbi:unnamed protein product [Caenorhabditis auriculariae]|uniref:TGF-beta family profile domain-containing protein n=1 Tax=Caenorhabditis auriculariae TaxID=2777116 RepID=A0A8S1H013_9PELO|nr:unnamed protein product [Caenorhabditis auriculariae]
MSKNISLYSIWLLILHFLTTASSKGIYFVEEKNDQTYAEQISGNVKKQVSNQILEILDLEDHESTASRYESPVASSFMQNLYSEMEESENNLRVPSKAQDWFNADKVVSITPIDISKQTKKFKLKFALEDFPDANENTLLAAQLRIHVEISDSLSSRISYMSGSSDDVQVATVSKTDPTAVFNFTSSLEKWLEKRDKTVIELTVEDGHTTSIDAFIVSSFRDNGFRQPKRRSRRAASTTPISRPPGTSRKIQPLIEHDGSTSCKKQGMYVDFEALGWKDWVIAPQGFKAYYCAGACTFPLHHTMNATSHAIVQALVHAVRPNAAKEAKCAPAQLLPMKILFVDNKKNVHIKRYRDMVVQECGCH